MKRLSLVVAAIALVACAQSEEAPMADAPAAAEAPVVDSTPAMDSTTNDSTAVDTTMKKDSI